MKNDNRTTTDRRTRAFRAQQAPIAIDFLLVAVHYSIHFEGGALPVEQANPSALKAARKAGLVEVKGYSERETDVLLTDDGRVRALSVLQEAEVDPEESEAVAEWAQSVAPRVKQFESTMDTWSMLELHAVQTMINEVRR